MSIHRRWWPLWLLALPTLIPVGATLASLLDISSPHWPHLLQVVLPAVALNTLWLVLAVVAGCAGLGIGLAWLMARYRFPGHALFHVALLLPLAMPGYVLGFVAIAGLDFAGPLQSTWRALSGQDTALWQIRSLPGAALTLAITLYPYVYLITHNAFSSLGASSIEVATSLGETRLLRRVAIPLAAPWIGGALLLVTMETLADFGTVALFNVDTFTTAIYKSWFGLFALDAALQLASVLILIALLLMAWHQQVQARQRMTQNAGRGLPALRLRGRRARMVCLGLGAFVLLSVGIPLATLLVWSLDHVSTELDPRYWQWLGHSLSLALGSAALLTAGALILAAANRHHPMPRLTRAATLGYALPGTLIAVGLFAPLAKAEGAMAGLISPGWVTQSLVVILLAYWARFFTVAHTPIAQQLLRLSPSLDEVSQTLGVSGAAMLRRVHAPLISGALGSAAALVVIDVIKEMPITLMTRPFGWDTLATRVFELTAEGEYHRAALPALTIVLAGMIPVSLLLRRADRHLRKTPDPPENEIRR